MSIFKDAYQTTAGSIVITRVLEQTLRESIIKDNIDRYSNLNIVNSKDFKPVFITGVYSSESSIPLFTHPISINYKDDKFLFTDLRLFVNKPEDLANISEYVKNRTEFNFAKSRAILNLVWLNEGPSYLKNSLNFSNVVFSAWLSEAIAKAYSLDYKDQLTISIITSIYYNSLFIPDSVFSKEYKDLLAVHTIKATKLSAAVVYEVIDKIDGFDSIETYCNYIASIVENIRLKDFNLTALLNIIRNSWYGTNAKEIIPIALEHPPTWNAIVYTSLNEKTYKNSSICKIAERFGKRGGSDEFNVSYKTIVDENTIKEAGSNYSRIRPFD